MPASALVSISFEASSVAEVQAVVDGLAGLPIGATVSTAITESRSGTVDESGNVVEFVPPPPPPPEDAVPVGERTPT